MIIRFPIQFFFGLALSSMAFLPHFIKISVFFFHCLLSVLLLHFVIAARTSKRTLKRVNRF